MTRRLLLSYLGLALLTLVILEAPLAVLGARHERDQAISQGEKVATGLAIATGEDVERQQVAALAGVANRYRQTTGGEVAVLGAGGQVLASSDTDHDNDINGSAAPYVRAALRGALTGGLVSDEGSPHVLAAAPLGTSGSGERADAVLLSLPAGSTVDRIHVLWAALAGFALVVVVGAWLIGRWMTGTISRPLERLGLAVSALDESNLEVRALTDDGPVEIRVLARQFNQMVNRLTELVRAQGRFVADASHQLRSPLTALRLRLENLEAAQPAGSEAVTRIAEEVQRLSRLVDGLITLGHADAVSPERQVVDVDQIVDERCEAWSALATERRVRLRVPELSRRRRVSRLVPGDLDQILDNLLANALDVTPPGGTIVVHVDGHRGAGYEIHVVDEGPGMTDDDVARAFDRFWQGAASAGSHGGLGLAIVRQLAGRNDLEIQLTAARGGGLDALVRRP